MTRPEASAVVQSLFSGWYPTLVRSILRAAGSQETAEDLVQDTFLLLYMALREGQRIENPKGWTLCVLRRQMGALWRSLDHHARYDSLDVLDRLPEGRTEPDVPLVSVDPAAALLDLLSSRESEVLLLRMQGMKYREIAEHLGISANSVSTLLARALRKLQQAAKDKTAREAIGNALDQDLSETL